MARDPQAALIALNRFGFGARGGRPATSSTPPPIRADSCWRNWRVRTARCSRCPACSTPELGKQVFDYQFEIKQARDAAKAVQQGASETPPQGADATPQQRRNLSLSSAAKEIVGKDPAMQAQAADGAGAAMTPSATMQSSGNPPKPPAQPLNIIQKTYRAEALARLQRGVVADCGFRRAARGVLVQPFLHLGQQGRAGADVGRLVRARGDPPACARPLRRYAEGGRAASGDAVLPRQPAVARPGLARRHQPPPRPRTRTSPARSWSCIRWASTAATPRAT